MGSAHRESRRRVWNVFKLLFLVAVLVAGGTALYPMWRSAQPRPAGSTDLTVRYRTDTAATAAVAKPKLEVVNTSKNTVSLSDVTLRYFFTGDGGPGYAFNCVSAAFDCSNVAGTIVALGSPTPTADHYLQIGFTAGAGSLAPGQDSKAIELQLFRLDHQNLNQENDRSFNAKDTKFTASKQVTAYLHGALVWGDEPGGDSAPTQSASGSASASASSAAPGAGQAAQPPLAPAGVRFDDFHYSGSDDPALIKDGWRIRTGAGGPGIHDTWSAQGISFPYEATAQGGQVLQLRATTDGTTAGTKQAEVHGVDYKFFTGTYAARIYFSDAPTSGRNGDHVNESFYTISPADDRYSELDSEYMPNGGWGAKGPVLDTTSWYSYKNGDRITQRHAMSLQGWHTVVITAVNGVATYSLDGKELYHSNGKYFPREGMAVDFNAWFVDLPFAGPRTWDMKVNWFYYNAGQAMSLPDIQKAVTGFYDSGLNHVNTVPNS